MSAPEVTDDREAMHRERSRRYAEAITTAAAADEKIKALTEQLAEHEYMWRIAEYEAGAASWIDNDGSTPWASNVDTHVYHVGEPEPDDSREFALSLSDGSIWMAKRWQRTEHNATPKRHGWQHVGYHSMSTCDWSAVLERAPLLTFTADTDFGLDQLVRTIERHTKQSEELRRRLPRDPDATSYNQDDLPRRLSVLENHHSERLAKYMGERDEALGNLRNRTFYAERMADALAEDATAEQRAIALEAWQEACGAVTS